MTMKSEKNRALKTTGMRHAAAERPNHVGEGLAPLSA
jgi:hypothetical protein